jgi:hypothetical protein
MMVVEKWSYLLTKLLCIYSYKKSNHLGHKLVQQP